jgi:hypothetical protein
MVSLAMCYLAYCVKKTKHISSHINKKKITYDPSVTYVDFARVFGDHKVSAFLNYLLFRAGFGWGNTPESQCTWLETKKEIQTHTHLTPDEQDRIVRILTQANVLKVTRTAPPAAAQWRLKNILTGKFRKGYGLFHYQVDWAHSLFANLRCWTTDEQSNKIKLQLAEYVAYKCTQNNDKKALKSTKKTKTTAQAKLRTKWKPLATEMVHQLVAIRRNKTGALRANEPMLELELEKVYKKLNQHKHHLVHIEQEFRYFGLIDSDDSYTHNINFDIFFQKIFGDGGEAIAYFQEQWNTLQLNKIAQAQTAHNTSATVPSSKIKSTEARALTQASEAIRQKWNELKTLLRIQTRKSKNKGIPKYIINQIHFGGFNVQTNTLTFLVPSKYLYEKLENNNYVQFIKKAIREAIGEGVKLQYMLLNLE